MRSTLNSDAVSAIRNAFENDSASVPTDYISYMLMCAV